MSCLFYTSYVFHYLPSATNRSKSKPVLNSNILSTVSAVLLVILIEFRSIPLVEISRTSSFILKILQRSFPNEKNWNIIKFTVFSDSESLILNEVMLGS